MDMVIFPCGQLAVLEMQTTIIDTGPDRRSEPLPYSNVVRGLEPPEEVFTAERRAEKSRCPSGQADKPVATPAHRDYHSVKIRGLHRSEHFGMAAEAFIPDSILVRWRRIRIVVQRTYCCKK